jgi:hypothetical protein
MVKGWISNMSLIYSSFSLELSEQARVIKKDKVFLQTEVNP